MSNKIINKLMLLTFVFAGLSSLQVKSMVIKPSELKNFFFKNSHGDSKIFKACIDNNLDLIEHSSNIMNTSNSSSIKKSEETGDIFNKHDEQIFNEKDLPCAFGDSNKNEIEELYSREPKIFNTADIDGNTPLHVACSLNNVDIVKYLYEKDVSLFDKTNNTNQSALVWACKDNALDVVKFFYSKENLRHLFYAEDQAEGTPITYACLNGHIDIVKFFYENDNLKKLFYKKDIYGQGPILLAYMEEKSEIIKYFYNIDIDHELINNELVTACEHNLVKIIDLTLRQLETEEEIEKFFTNYIYKGFPILNLACNIGDIEIIEFILEKISKLKNYNEILKLRTKNGATPLHVACVNNRIEVVKILHAKDNNLINEKSNLGAKPILYSCNAETAEIIDFIISKERDQINETDSNGLNLLHYACTSKKENIIKHIMKMKPSLSNKVDHSGRIPIEFSKFSNTLDASLHKKLTGEQNISILTHIEKIKKEQKNKASDELLNFCITEDWDNAKKAINKNITKESISLANSSGETSLILACRSDQKDLIKLILNKNNNDSFINASTNDNKTALLAACLKKQWDIVKILIKCGAKKSIGIIALTLKCSPLSIACKCNETEIIKLFLNTFDCKKLIESLDLSKKTPLISAFENKNDEIIELFLNIIQKDNIDCEIYNKKTMFDLACEYNCPKIASILISNGAEVKEAHLKLSTNKDLTEIIEKTLKIDNEIAANLKEDHAKKIIEQNTLEIIKRIALSKKLTIKNKQIILLEACKTNKTDIIKLILEKNITQEVINTTNNENQTPLYFACLNKNWEIAILLIKKGARKSISICSNSTDKSTPLTLASKENATQIIKLFLSCSNCSKIIDLTDQNNKTPMAYACENNNIRAIKCISSNGGKISQENIKNSLNKKTINYLNSLLEKNTKNNNQITQAINEDNKKTNKKTNNQEIKATNNTTTSKGSTGRIIALNNIEKKAMELVRAKPTGYMLKTVKMDDPRWPGKEGWFKMEQVVEVKTENGDSDFVTIHYVHRDNSAKFDDFKFKDFKQNSNNN